MADLPSWFLIAAVVVVIGFVAVVAVAIVIGVFISRQFGRIGRARARLQASGVRIAATISDVQVRHDMMSKNALDRVYVYTAAAADPQTGQLRTFTQRFGTPMYRMGDPVVVLVDPTNPSLYMFSR